MSSVIRSSSTYRPRTLERDAAPLDGLRARRGWRHRALWWLPRWERYDSRWLLKWHIASGWMGFAQWSPLCTSRRLLSGTPTRLQEPPPSVHGMSCSLSYVLSHIIVVVCVALFAAPVFPAR